MAGFAAPKGRGEFADVATSRQDHLIAGSTGAIPVMIELLNSLPETFPFPILICQHRGRQLPNRLAEVLGKRVKLCVKFAQAGDVLEAGTVYIAPEHSHFIIHQDCCIGLIDGRRIQFLVSAADPLFASAASAFGNCVVAIVLTGFGRDAALGVNEIKEHGGHVIVQDLASSQATGMPNAAIGTGCVDQILSIPEIIDALLTLAANTESA